MTERASFGLRTAPLLTTVALDFLCSKMKKKKNGRKDTREKLRLAKIELGLHLIAAFVSPLHCTIFNWLVRLFIVTINIHKIFCLLHCLEPDNC